VVKFAPYQLLDASQIVEHRIKNQKIEPCIIFLLLDADNRQRVPYKFLINQYALSAIIFTYRNAGNRWEEAQCTLLWHAVFRIQR
jgi:hypothetical protein